MNRWSSWVLVAASPLTLMLYTADAWSCTTFMARHGGQVVVGNSYDWDQGAALVTVNARGLEKEAFVIDASTPATWTSQYGSVTINQYGVELPNAGMNEVGLVVEQMWLSDTEYPDADERPALIEVQWIQHALDRFATVSELVEAAPTVRISPIYADLHYLACDSGGDCAVFEFLDGELVITSGEDLVVPTLANHTYAESVAFLAQHTGFGGTDEIPTSEGSLDRFVRASALASDSSGGEVPAAAFEILGSVSQESFTKWNLVYATETKTLYWRTHASSNIKELPLEQLDFDCSAQRLVIDIDSNLEGNVVDHLEPYATETNQALLEITMTDLGLPAPLIALVASYPESLTCDSATAPDESDNSDSGGSSGGGCTVTRSPSLSWGWVMLLFTALGFARRHRRR